MPGLSQLRPFLESDDVARSVDFYTTVFGFECLDRLLRPDGSVGWASLRRDQVALMVGARHTHEGEEADHQHPAAPVLTGSLYLNVDDVDAWAAHLQARGVDAAYGPTDTDHGMREVALSDPDGYFLVLGCPMSS